MRYKCAGKLFQQVSATGVSLVAVHFRATIG
jgi:hypothetical protein